MSYPGGRRHRIHTTVTEDELRKLEEMADDLDATRSDFLRQLILIAIGARDLRANIKAAMRDNLWAEGMEAHNRRQYADSERSPPTPHDPYGRRKT